jgi:hypothetical protein
MQPRLRRAGVLLSRSCARAPSAWSSTSSPRAPPAGRLLPQRQRATAAGAAVGHAVDTSPRLRESLRARDKSHLPTVRAALGAAATAPLTKHSARCGCSTRSSFPAIVLLAALRAPMPCSLVSYGRFDTCSSPRPLHKPWPQTCPARRAARRQQLGPRRDAPPSPSFAASAPLALCAAAQPQRQCARVEETQWRSRRLLLSQLGARALMSRRQRQRQSCCYLLQLSPLLLQLGARALMSRRPRPRPKTKTIFTTARVGNKGIVISKVMDGRRGERQQMVKVQYRRERVPQRGELDLSRGSDCVLGSQAFRCDAPGSHGSQATRCNALGSQAERCGAPGSQAMRRDATRRNAARPPPTISSPSLGPIEGGCGLGQSRRARPRRRGRLGGGTAVPIRAWARSPRERVLQSGW